MPATGVRSGTYARGMEGDLESRLATLEGRLDQLAAQEAATRLIQDTALLGVAGGQGGAGGGAGRRGAGGGGGGAAGSVGGSGGVVQSVVVNVRRIYATSALISLVVGVIAGVIANHLS